MSTTVDHTNTIRTPEQIREDLNSVSPLALPQVLIDYEIADMQSSLEILEQIHKEFEGGPGVIQTMAEPVVCSLIDASLRVAGKNMVGKNLNGQKPGRGNGPAAIQSNHTEAAQKKAGLTASRILFEIKSFRYPEEAKALCKETSYLDLTDKRFDRKHLEDKKAMDTYKSKKFGWDNKDENNLEYKINKRIGTVEDEYQSGTMLYFDKKAAQQAGVEIPKERVAATDHVVPLKQMSNVLAKHLTAKDQKLIANQDFNLRLMGQSDNASKNARTAKEYAEEKGKNLKHKEELKKAQDSAEAAILTKASITALDNNISSNLIPTLVVPIGYEIYEMMTRGICFGTETDNLLEASGIRLKRVANYLARRLPELLKGIGQDIWKLLTDILASMVASLLGKFKRIIIEGYSILIEALRILSQPKSKVSLSEKADAIVKLVAGPLSVLIIDSLLSAALSALNIPIWLSEIISAVSATILTTFVMYFLDKIDLFSVKSERRLARVREIFDERILQIRESTKNFDIVAHETIKAQRVQFEALRYGIETALKSKNMETLNQELDQTVDFFKVDIPYRSPLEFLEFIRHSEKIAIGA